jgi:AcrR family transcriptional regulator
MPRKAISPQALEAAAKRREVAAAYLAGGTQAEIAAAVGLSQGTVSRHLRAVREEWKARSAEAFEGRLAEELARIDALERVALAAWERSCHDAEVRHVKTETDGTVSVDGRPVPTKTVSEKTTKGQAGDPRFLERIAWCIEQRLKVLGGYAPAKVAPTTPDGTAPYGATHPDGETGVLLDRFLALMGQHYGGQGGPGTAPQHMAGSDTGRVSSPDSALPQEG